MNSFILRFNASSLALHPLVLAFAALALTLLFLPNVLQHGFMEISPRSETSDEVDAGLQRAALLAISGHEGTVIVMEAQTGRIRAMVNPRMATEQAFAPGSTIKPFATLAALRSGVINEKSRLLCRETYRRGDFEIKCSHAKEQPPLSPRQALAYSCNYFFGELGERLSAEKFARTLTSFGFGEPTGIGSNEARGVVPRGPSAVSNTLGEGDSLQVTPMQLITAYAALVNGGHLNWPQQASAFRFIPKERARIDIAADHRQVLIDGMRGAIEYGTAEKSGLGSLPLNILGKTGTSTANDSAQTQGWFVGLATDQDAPNVMTPESVKLVVLVFFKHSHGAESAVASRVVFEEFARLGSRGDKEARGPVNTEQVDASARLANIRMPVRVHLARENVTRTMSLEDYVLGVVSAEGSVENELESLKALAIASRTYALRNLYRHRGDDYDFCTLTHCQRYFAIGREGARDAVVRAVDETAGEILRDSDSQIVESYFSASCGGMTANIQTLWGVAPKSYLRGTRDDNCRDRPNSSWTDVISAESLAAALSSDPRSDVGPALNSVRLLKRDSTGRAELIEVSGARRHTLRGWDFKIIVGRALGWHLLKSSRFEVSREGANYIFHGSGFGHGLGLCQEGAHVMAANGIGYRQILARYFPGTTLRKEDLVRDKSRTQI